jgi:hypothetical protein
MTQEMLKSGSWYHGIDLSPYWHSNLTATYPKNTYFIIGYIATLVGDFSIGVQWYSVLVFVFSALVIHQFVSAVLPLLLPEWERKDPKPYLPILSLLVISIPVITLHAFIRADLLMHILILSLFTLILWALNRQWDFFDGIVWSLLSFVIIWTKFTALFSLLPVLVFAFVAGFRYRSYQSSFFRGVLVVAFVWWPLLLALFMYNAWVYWHPFYPANINKFESYSITQIWELFPRILLNFIYSDAWSVAALRDIGQIPEIPKNPMFNYDRGLWYLSFLIPFAIIFVFFRVRSTKYIIGLFGVFMVTWYLVHSLDTNLLLYHRYSLYFYIVLVTIAGVALCYIPMKWLRNSIIGVILLANIIAIAPSVGAYGVKISWFLQSTLGLTGSTVCNKILFLGDISRADFRNIWNWTCNTLKNEKILLVHQAWTHYYYGRDGSNTLLYYSAQNEGNFSKYLDQEGVNYVVTANKNNLYSQYGNNEGKIYTTTHDSNDESILFCTPETPYELGKLTRIRASFELNRPRDTRAYLLLNNGEESRELTGSTLDWIPQTEELNSLCVILYDQPVDRFDRAEKYIRITSLELFDIDGKPNGVSARDLQFVNRSLEEIWLSQKGWIQVMQSNFKDLDTAIVWKRPE